jgi:hypothetical protein
MTRLCILAIRRVAHAHVPGNATTDANSTGISQAGGTSCRMPGDQTGYWMPTLVDGDRA